MSNNLTTDLCTQFCDVQCAHSLSLDAWNHMREYITDSVIINLISSVHELYISDTQCIKFGKVIEISDIPIKNCTLSDIIAQVKSKFLRYRSINRYYKINIRVQWDFTEPLQITYDHIIYILKTSSIYWFKYKTIPEFPIVMMNEFQTLSSDCFSRNYFNTMSRPNKNWSVFITQFNVTYETIQDIMKGG